MTTETTRPDAALVVLVVWLLGELARRASRPRKPRRRRNAARDAEIMRLRVEDPRRWTYKRLGGKFGLTPDGARKVCGRHGRRGANTGH